MTEGAAWTILLLCGGATLNCAIQLGLAHTAGVMQGWGRRRGKPIRRGEPAFRREVIGAWALFLILCLIDAYLFPMALNAL